jgi:Zn-dependent M28 family amino/carboxypeptidase
LRPTETGGQPLLDLVRRQVDLGPRFPGSEAHRLLAGELAGALEEHAAEAHRQRFTVPLPGGPAECGNLTGIFRPAEAGSAPALGPLLLGTHFDTRLTADREPEPASRSRPIPGANDGGSGTAILLSLLPELARLAQKGKLAREVRVVFFDAEDVGGIGGLPFSLGAGLYAAQPPFGLPGEVLVLDMVGGGGLELDVDGHALDHPPSLQLTRRVFASGGQVDAAVFRAAKLKHVICDHYPFLRKGIASCLLIDLDYPEWHTQADLPEAMSERSLATIAAAVLRFVQEPRR